MKFLDLGVAAVIATSSFLFILATSPTPWDRSSSHELQVSKARDALTARISDAGLFQLSEDALVGLCSVQAALSSPSLAVTVSSATSTCGPSPRPGTPFAEVELQLGHELLEVRGWDPDKA
ncbi:MAG: hypothetical protein HY247_02210 [archaeon]|nr:MAG: hypothetical protein HY247_02210 [archaeon]